MKIMPEVRPGVIDSGQTVLSHPRAHLACNALNSDPGVGRPVVMVVLCVATVITGSV